MNIYDNGNILNYSYQFKPSNHEVIQIDLKIDSKTTTLISEHEAELPLWTKLEFQQCFNCPLNMQDSPHCPVAGNLFPLIEACSSMVSFDEVDVRIVTNDRVISAHTTAQHAVSSVLGLVMATSPCPHTGYLKPMAHFHVPLSGEEEGIYRTVSMYLLAQYFRSKKGVSHNYDVVGLTEIYQNLKVVNRAMAERLRAAIKQDAAVNAIILLDLLTQAVTWSIEEELQEIEYLFQEYIQKK